MNEYIYKLMKFVCRNNPEVVVLDNTIMYDLNEYCKNNHLEFISFTKTPTNDPIHNASIAIGIFKRKEKFNCSAELNKLLWK